MIPFVLSLSLEYGDGKTFRLAKQVDFYKNAVKKNSIEEYSLFENLEDTEKELSELSDKLKSAQSYALEPSKHTAKQIKSIIQYSQDRFLKEFYTHIISPTFRIK